MLAEILKVKNYSPTVTINGYKFLIKIGQVKIQGFIDATAGTHTFIESYSSWFSACATGHESGNNENTGIYRQGLTAVSINFIQGGRKGDIITVGV